MTPAEAPYRQPTGGNWTGWLSRDDPRAAADWESLAELRASVPCQKPLAIECRAKDGRDWTETGQRYKCSLEDPEPEGLALVLRTTFRRTSPRARTPPPRPLNFHGKQPTVVRLFCSFADARLRVCAEPVVRRRYTRRS